MVDPKPPNIPLSTVLSGLAMVVAVVVAWTVTREQARTNVADLVKLELRVDRLEATLDDNQGRLITLENTSTYNQEKLEALGTGMDSIRTSIDRIVDYLIQKNGSSEQKLTPSPPSLPQ